MAVLISASQVGAILGVSPHLKCDQVMRRMVRQHHQADREEVENPAILHGILHEPNALMAYHLETGRLADKNTDRFTSGIYLSEPDSLVWDPETESWGTLELKCPYGIRLEIVPAFKSIHDMDHYYAQAQVEMFCTGTDWCDFFQWTPYGRRIERVHPDPSWWALCGPEVARFYDDFQLECMTPERHLLPRLKRHNNARLRRLVEEFDQMADAIQSANARQCELLQEILSATKGNEAEVCGKLLLRRPSDPGYGASLKSTWSLSK